MEKLVTIAALASYVAVVWYLYGSDIVSWLRWLQKRMTEYAEETRVLNRMWDNGG